MSRGFGHCEYRMSVLCRLYFSSRSTNVRDGSVRSTKRTSLSSTRGGAQPASSTTAPGQGASGPASRTSPRNSDNSVHPGPIFLRHVVSRPFEYRWLILASTVITCMTIIVIVSVVYSNVWISFISELCFSRRIDYQSDYTRTDTLMQMIARISRRLSANIYYIFIRFSRLFARRFFRSSTVTNARRRRLLGAEGLRRGRWKCRTWKWRTSKIPKVVVVALFRKCLTNKKSKREDYLERSAYYAAVKCVWQLPAEATAEPVTYNCLLRFLTSSLSYPSSSSSS